MVIRLLLFLALAALIYFAGRRWWIAREAAELTKVLEEVPNAIPYFPEEKTYGDLTDEQQPQLETIEPSRSSMAGARPCRVTLDDGTELACVFIAPAQDYINTLWEWPEDWSGDDPDSAAVNRDVVIVGDGLARYARTQPTGACRLTKQGRSAAV